MALYPTGKMLLALYSLGVLWSTQPTKTKSEMHPDDLLAVASEAEKRILEAQLVNLFYQLLSKESSQYVVTLGEDIELGDRVRPLIPVINVDLPVAEQVNEIVRNFVVERGLSDENNFDFLVKACLGLSVGEINLILKRSYLVSEGAIRSS